MYKPYRVVEIERESTRMGAIECINDCTSFDIQQFSLMCTISKRKTRITSNQVAASCPTSRDLTIKCISLEQSMEDVNLKLQHSESSSSGTETVCLSERVIYDPK